MFSIVGLICFLGVGYADFSTTFTVNGTGKVIERSKMIQSWTSTSNEDFHTAFYRENIVTITFLDSNAVPSNSVESWDVSVDKDGGVMAYVVESNSETGKYDLYIGANEDSSYLFYNFVNVNSVEFGDSFDTSKVLNMAFMFCECKKNDTLNISSFDTSRVTNMHGMFYHCEVLTPLDLKNFNTSNVTNMYYMFYACYDLTILDLCSFDTNNVINMGSMFRTSPKLKAIYVGSNWTTANADTTDMFLSSGVSSVTTGECAY